MVLDLKTKTNKKTFYKNAKTTSEHLSVLSLYLSLSLCLRDSLHFILPLFKLLTFKFFASVLIFICQLYVPALLSGKKTNKKKPPVFGDKMNFTPCADLDPNLVVF